MAAAVAPATHEPVTVLAPVVSVNIPLVQATELDVLFLQGRELLRLVSPSYDDA